MKPSEIFLSKKIKLSFSLNSFALDLIDKLYDDDRIYLINECAYILATVKHETAGTYRPIEEFGRGKGKKYGIPDKQTGRIYYGRGYVQLTWKDNYKKLSPLVHVDLVSYPNFALEAKYAYDIMIEGMRRGLFTGRKLSDYFTEKTTDYYNARKIINGLDKAIALQVYAFEFENLLEKIYQ